MAASGKRFVCIGAGGHANSVMEVIASQQEHECAGFLDPDPGLRGTSICGVPVLGGDEETAALAGRGVTGFLITIGLGGQRDQWKLRADRYAAALRHGLEPVTLIHPSASVSRFATVGRGVVVMPGAIINAGVKVSDNVIVNSGAIIEHDCSVADHCHVATGAILCGQVRLEEGVHAGAGCVIRQLQTVGRGAVIGAGAVVAGDVDPGVTVAGVPAKPL